MAIHLTEKEKADRFDALQVAFKYTKEQVDERRRMCNQRYSDSSVIGAYNKGLFDGYGYFIEALERWLI